MIDKLEMFIALAQERHFGRAAKTCGITQPTLSSAIKQLEEQFGVQLVYRGARFQGLTPEGQRLLEKSRPIVADTRALRDEMRNLKRGLTGHIRLGVIPTALPMITDLTTPFLTRHPNVRMTILSRPSADILNGIEQLELDAGVTYLDNEPLGRVSKQPLYTEFYRLLCAPSSPLAERSHIAWGDLHDLPLCLLTGDMQNRRIINQHLTDAGIIAAPLLESNSTITLLSHVMQGKWMSILPKKLADLFMQSGRLCAIPIVSPEVEHQVGLIATYHDPHTPLIAALFDNAKQIFGTPA